MFDIKYASTCNSLLLIPAHPRSRFMHNNNFKTVVKSEDNMNTMTTTRKEPAITI